MFNHIYNNYHRHSILLKKEPGLSSILGEVFLLLKNYTQEHNNTKATTGMYKVSL